MKNSRRNRTAKAVYRFTVVYDSGGMEWTRHLRARSVQHARSKARLKFGVGDDQIRHVMRTDG